MKKIPALEMWRDRALAAEETNRRLRVRLQNAAVEAAALFDEKMHVEGRLQQLLSVVEGAIAAELTTEERKEACSPQP